MDPTRLHWGKNTQRRAAIVGTLIFFLTFMAMQRSSKEILPFWRVALPILLAWIFFGMSGRFMHSLQMLRDLAQLPEVRYPFRTAYCLLGGEAILLLFLLGYYLASLASEPSSLAGLWTHPFLLILMALLLMLVVSSGGQLIDRVQKDGTRTLADSLSRSRLARQDVFFSLIGVYRDGFILGWLYFPFKDIRESEEKKYSLQVQGTDCESRPYSLILYTPRWRKLVMSAIRESRGE